MVTQLLQVLLYEFFFFLVQLGLQAHREVAAPALGVLAGALFVSVPIFII
jgi:hypothetical protein